MGSDKLAIHGGSPALQGRVLGRWAKLRRGLRLSTDVLKMIPKFAGGSTTTVDGSGIVGKFEKEFRELTGSSFALAMNNGTATLHSAYFAVGVGPGSEVIVPSFTFHATATPILQCGATPVFCDIDPSTLVADPDDIERRITERTKAISVVHIWGNPAEMDRIVAIGDRYGIPVIEDCSHAHGAVYKGKSVGTWGAIGCFSLNSGKAVDGGEAGVAVTDDPRLFDHMLLLGHYRRMRNGQAANTFDVGDMNLGVKYRPHTSAIYLARSSLKRLPKLNARRAQAWRWLVDELAGVPGLRPISTTPGAVRGGYYSFVLAYEAADQDGPSRDAFLAAAKAEGVPITAITPDQYGMLHKAPLFTTFNRPSLGGGCYDPTRSWEETLQPVSLPVTEQMALQLVRLPPLDTASEKFVRRCGYAMKKVMLSLVAQSEQGYVEDAVERGSAAAHP